MPEPLYGLRDVTLEYGSRRVLDIATLDFARGGVTALVGPNGAGKSTLLRILAFLLPPTRGTITFDGARIDNRDTAFGAARRRVTLVAQSPFIFHRSVRANVAYGLRARGVRNDERAMAALAAVGLGDFADLPAWKLSGGEAQRVAVARALAIDPPVYLFDEPTANVDREHVAIIETVIAQLAAAGKTVILTTHDLDQAHRLSDTVLSVVAGHVTAAPLLNVLRGVTTRHNGESYFDSDGLHIEIATDTAPQVIAIDPEDILISREPLHSSARNHAAGAILKVERDGASVLVTVDCGIATPMIARITQHSYTDLGLNLGMRVWLTFKSSAIHILDM
ncbi:MAG: ATP-binding cassette domain-containing protein [Deltaproteobacteria bacterium]|nr:ATP-binding cassette domain-containing protein [Deltaproteobacteria bacterium]MBI3388523.1 ATP-binding cassette domain-containing protein [Deltaproteobacteria bacterium]